MISPSEAESLALLKIAATRWVVSQGLAFAEAEDVFQQAMLKAISSESSLKEDEKIVSWFYQILRNTLLDELRKKNTIQKKAKEFTAWESLVQDELDQETERVLCQCVSQLLEELPKEDQKILQKHFFEGKSYAHLGKEFQKTEGSIRVQAHRARSKLKAAFQSCCNATRFEDVQDCGCDGSDKS